NGSSRAPNREPVRRTPFATAWILQCCRLSIVTMRSASPSLWVRSTTASSRYVWPMGISLPCSCCDDVDVTVAVFESHRRRLFGIAYRMLGSVAAAEDMVQEAWLRWNAADRDAVVEPGAYLATVVTRLSIAEATSARARRESYVGPWLPEPVDTAADPLLGAERAEALSLGVLVLLEKLSPAERA